jgi:hypothetical protein
MVIFTGLDKYTSLLHNMHIAARDLYYKSLETDNVWKMDKLVSLLLLVTFTDLDKHTSLLNNMCIY